VAVVAWNTALAIAAAAPTWPISPPPLTPSAPAAVSSTSTDATVTSGASALTGSRYSPPKLLEIQPPVRASNPLPSSSA
jgi:hypothetical protein